ncbi:MAG: ZIP family metal transporter [Patescibacteria group bacterium]|nr:ZIP family metal transporter [Patescibacteria group bacterium]MDD5715750.1 ZIP family metal transporter [Patescibacteria group bacterium]
MFVEWSYTLLSVLAISVVSLIGVVTLSFSDERLRKLLLILVSFAAGSLLGGALLHLLPEAAEALPDTRMLAFWILFGITMFFVLEKIIHWRHCHVVTSQDHPHPVAVSNFIGDGLHNFIDGMVIAAAYLVNPHLGFTTTVAVLLHEIPQEMGDFGILIHAGLTKRKALLYNFLSACLAIVGALVVLSIGISLQGFQDVLVAFTIGGFVYIASADLIPELKKETELRKSIIQLIAFLAGVGVMALFLLIE